MTSAFTSIAFAPLIPWMWIAAMAGAAFLLVAFGLFRRARSTLLRALVLSLLLLALLNPSLVEEQRRLQQDVALVVVDESASQTIGERAEQTAVALEQLRERLARPPG